MIISRTPFRMSFIGGGTDLPAFYEKQQGAVISTTIDKYMYVSVNKRFDDTIRLSYSQTEIVDKLEDLKHGIVREAMKMTGIASKVEITTVADIPAGTGLGSSSSLAVGVLNALRGYRGFVSGSELLARQACYLEIDTLKEPIGKQDQYAAAYGGLRRYLFNPDGTVQVDPVTCTPRRREDFFDHLMLFYMGGTRAASDILANPDVRPLDDLRYLVDDFWNILTSDRDLRLLGDILHQGWERKKQMGGITNSDIDTCYNVARQAGALGGKILGAGQAGFLMLFVPPERQNAVRHDLWYGPNPREIKFRYEFAGSQIVYAG